MPGKQKNNSFSILTTVTWIIVVLIFYLQIESNGGIPGLVVTAYSDFNLEIS